MGKYSESVGNPDMAKVTDLWHLDILGITDPIEKSTKSLEEQPANS